MNDKLREALAEKLKLLQAQALETRRPIYLYNETANEIIAALSAPSGYAAGIEAAAKAGWNACRKSIYAVCEDVGEENEKHRSDTENAPRHHFGRGGMSAAKSIARGFNSMEAEDDDNYQAAIRSLLGTTTGERGSIVAWQSMDSAPKDGTVVDLYGTRNGEPSRFPDARWSRDVLGGMELDTFSWSHRGWDIYGKFTYSHWRPLPAPPDRGEHLSPGDGG